MCSRYVAWKPDRQAEGIDAFTVQWDNVFFYAFPPFSMVDKVLMKIQDDQVSKAILIIPMWATQHWYPTLLNLLIGIPKILPNVENLLQLVHNKKNHPMCRNHLFLVACLISGHTSKVKAFQNTLSDISHNHGKGLLQNSMTSYGTNGLFGVINGKLIPYTRLRVKF